MRELALVVMVTALLIGATAVAIYGFQDRGLFVPPPDAVAEGFMREVVTRRFDQAAEYLLDKRSHALPALAGAIEFMLGQVDDIETHTISSTKDQAVVKVRLRSGRGSERLEVKTVWNGVAWKVVTPR